MCVYVLTFVAGAGQVPEELGCKHLNVQPIHSRATDLLCYCAAAAAAVCVSPRPAAIDAFGDDEEGFSRESQFVERILELGRVTKVWG
jgi:hypothetical protein